MLNIVCSMAFSVATKFHSSTVPLSHKPRSKDNVNKFSFLNPREQYLSSLPRIRSSLSITIQNQANPPPPNSQFLPPPHLSPIPSPSKIPYPTNSKNTNRSLSNSPPHPLMAPIPNPDMDPWHRLSFLFIGVTGLFAIAVAATWVTEFMSHRVRMSRERGLRYV